MEQSKTEEKEVLISHLFNAPRELVFKAWTDPQLLVNWYAPDGCTIEFKILDVTQNGEFHSCVHDPVHGDCWIKGTYQEVVFPEKLVFTMILTDEQGSAVEALAAGKPEDWPQETITTVTFAAIGEQTKLTLHQTIPEAQAKATGAYQSWIKMFNKLEGILS